jgi:hypothetical protein
MGAFQVTPYDDPQSAVQMSDGLYDYLDSLQNILAGNDDQGMGKTYYLLNPAVAMAKSLFNLLNEQANKKPQQ